MKHPVQPSHGFSLTELLFVIGIIGVLTAILVPVVLTSRKQAQSTACLSNVRQLCLATLSYTQDYDGSYPAATSMVFRDGVGDGNGVSFWYDLVLPYTKSSVFICPSRPTPKLHEHEVFTCGYALNADLNQAHRAHDTTVYTGKSETAVSVQSNLVAIFEARAGIIATDRPDREVSVRGISPADMQEEIKAQKPGAFRHRDSANYAFVDGHAKWLRPRVFVSPCDETHPCFEP